MENSTLSDALEEYLPEPAQSGFAELNLKTYFFNTDDLNKVQIFIHECARAGKASCLGASLVTLVSELYYHSVIENFKYVFMKFLIKEMGMEYLDIVEKYDLFYAEMNSSRAENFKSFCKANDIYVSLSCWLDSDAIYINTSHFGKLNSHTARKIQNIIRNIDTFSFKKNLHQLVSQSRVMDKYDKGLPMALFTFRGLGISDEYFKITDSDNKVAFNVTIPLAYYQTSNEDIKISNDPGNVKNTVWEIFDELELATVTFSCHGNILEVSSQLLNILNLDHDKVGELKSYIPDNFFEDLFVSPFSVHNFTVFENYRITVPVKGKNLHCLFNVSGIKKSDNTIVTLWQAVNIDNQRDKFTRGSLFENMNIMRLVSPYIPKMVLEKARNSIKQGLSSLPIESENATIFFADLAGFTEKSESMNHQEIVELLNLTMGTIVSNIDRHGGYVDKFIGDGIMCIFFDELSAVVAAVEIQNNLINLNEFRAMTEQPLLELRIGINSGRVILGSIGTKERMDWTALGDVVNTASRIESNTPVNNIGISNTTYDLIKDKVTIKNQATFKLKGKEKEQILFFVESVLFVKDNRQIKLDLIQPE